MHTAESPQPYTHTAESPQPYTHTAESPQPYTLWAESPRLKPPPMLQPSRLAPGSALVSSASEGVGA